MAIGEDTAAKKFRRGITVASSAEIIYQLTGSNMSSPQTAELNADARAPTISKWVNITSIEVCLWTAFLSWLYGNLWPVVGAGLAWSGMWGKYRYAIVSGLKSDAPPTENYNFNKNDPRGARHR